MSVLPLCALGLKGFDAVFHAYGKQANLDASLYRTVTTRHKTIGNSKAK